jgi:hypothetical protein
MANKTIPSRSASAPISRLSTPSLDETVLPPAVARLRGRILQATGTGDIESLKIPIQWNEVPPLFKHDQPLGFDAVEFLKQRSFDGRGQEMLRIIKSVFEAPFAKLTRGMTETFVWPVFPSVPNPTPWPQEHLAPWSCVRFADLSSRSKAGGPLIHHTAIGLDGTWHYFWTEE